MRSIPFIRSFLVVLILACVAVSAAAQVSILITTAPPALPVYDQPICPGQGYLWTPGYWAYDNGYGDYYWVPGTWVMAPQVGMLWTPPYWGWAGSGFMFYPGYWGPQVGFYGGVAYGYGYYGRGYEGGRWNNGQFYYNRSVNNVNITNIHNVYNTTVINETNVNRVSYNGGNGGISAHPSSAEESAMHERHLPPIAVQNEHVQAARNNPQSRASRNQGKPEIAATPKPGALNDRAAVPAKEAGAAYHPAAMRAAVTPTENVTSPHAETEPAHQAAPIHAKDLPSHPAPVPVNTGNARQDQKYQQQQQKLYAKQQSDHQSLQQSQEQDHQRLAQQKSSEAQTQQVEQKHQQQTQQMEQKHAQQQQTLQAKQPASKNQPKPAK